jgi:predicted aspartyl protease
MKAAYVPAFSPSPLPMLRGATILPRPILHVRISGPAGDHLTDGLLDTGADYTVFELAVATQIGLDLNKAPLSSVQLVGRKPFTCAYAQVQLRISDGKETFEWLAVVGFVPFRIRRPLLGYSGFLQFFDAEFHGADPEVILTPNRDFAGRRI